jgi:hypothetical protein
MLSAEVKAEIESRLNRAQQFLDFARLAEGDAEYANPVVSLCVQSAIAASDAVLLAAEQSRNARAGHEQAPGALRAVGQDSIAAALTRLLRLKPRAQYSAGETCTLTHATDALRDAARTLDTARKYCERKVGA